jgi:amidase
MDFAHYLQHDATALAALVQRGEVAPAELLELALRRNAEVHGRINAVCRLLEPQARAQLTRSPTGPLAGVPFLIKDGVQDYAGVPTSFGSRSMRGYVPADHAAVVRRYLGAGLVIFGKTNLPEFALKAVTDPVLYGRASNPWNLGHTPGGSSGGAAAAVAAGIVPMAAGNDGGGSIRIPAACCGLFGLLPSRGRAASSLARRNPSSIEQSQTPDLRLLYGRCLSSDLGEKSWRPSSTKAHGSNTSTRSRKSWSASRPKSKWRR